MRVCYFGTYDPAYSRNKILIRGLEENEVTVLECRTDKRGLSKYFDLFKKHWVIRKDYDVMVVGFPGFQAVILARFLTSKPIIFDAFVSMYDSMVLDRGEAKPFSLRAKYYWWLDKISMTFPEVVLFDTQNHIDFVKNEFGIQDNKFVRIFVGADMEVFFPKKESKWQPKGEKFKVVSYGHYVPLQGMEYVVKSAYFLKDYDDIEFKIIGDGKGKDDLISFSEENNLRNIEFISNIPLEDLALLMSEADVCLGIFGNSPKTKRVIPNKVYEAVALKKPVITSDTPAVRELFSPEDLFLIEVSSAESIAKNILFVKENKEEAERRAENAYSKLLEFASTKELGLQLKKIAEMYVK
ncbi:MAG: glycosyltransferase [Minisyncoccia bacterium]